MKTQFATGSSLLDDSFEAGKTAAKQAISKLSDFSPHLVMLFCSTRYDYPSVIRGVLSMTGEDIPLIGCTAAGQFTETGNQEDGVTCALIASDQYRFFSGIGTQLKSHPREAIRNAAVNFPKQVEGYPHQSALLLMDGLSDKGEEAVAVAAQFLGSKIQLVGAAAADNLASEENADPFFQESAVFSDRETSSDAVSICLITSHSPLICVRAEEKQTGEALGREFEMAQKGVPKGTHWAGALVLNCAGQTTKAVEAIQQVLGAIPFIGFETDEAILLKERHASAVIILFSS